MSTNHHTAIATGAAANASTFNAPLGALDAAIDSEVASAVAAEAQAREVADDAEAAARAAGDDALDDRIDNIITHSGTSSTEVVDSRTAGNTGSAAGSLTERMEWLEGATTFYAAAYGLDDGASAGGNTTALNAAIDAAAATGEPAVVMLPAGRFQFNNFTLDANVVLRGAGMPRYDYVSNLQGGTVLVSGLITLSDRAGLMDLGIVDDSVGAIDGGGSDDCMILNVAVLGHGADHGCVFTTGQRNLVRNYFAAEFLHGLVFKGSHNMASGLRFVNCGTSALTLTSDAGVDVTGNVISHIHSVNDNVDAGGSIRIYTGTAGESIFGNVIENFYLQDAGIGLFCQAKASVGSYLRYNRVANGYIEAPQTNGVWLQASDSVAANGPDSNDFSGITVVDAANYSFFNQHGGNHNALSNCRSIGPVTAHTSGAWAKVDVGLPLGLSLRLGKTATLAVANGLGAWTDIIWESEGFDPFGMHAANAAPFSNPPAGSATYRIRACIVFAANATGVRAIRIARSVSGGAYASVIEQMVSPGAATVDCQVNLEFIAVFNSSYAFQVQAMQSSGGSLNIQTNSHVTVELLYE